MFLSPLSKVLGKLNVSIALLNICDEKERSILHALGNHLSMQDWIDDYDKLLDIGFYHKQNHDISSRISDNSPLDQVCDTNKEEKPQTRYQENG